MCASRDGRNRDSGPFITSARVIAGQILLDRFEIIEQLGEGGLGEVWRARDRRLRVDRALKILSFRVKFEQRAAQQLEKEAHLTACLKHPHIVPLHDIVVTPDGYPVLVFDYLPGWQKDGRLVRSLDDWLLHFGKMSEADVRRLLPPILDALHHAHTFRNTEIRNGVVHKDLKPSNVLLDAGGFPRVIDFHIAQAIRSTASRVSGAITPQGSLAYMSPEQLRGHRTDARSDIYSVGIMVYELLTGNPPFQEGDIAHQHMNEPVPRIPDVSPELEAWVQRAVQKDPGLRWQSCAQMKAALLDPYSVPIPDVSVQEQDAGRGVAAPVDEAVVSPTDGPFRTITDALRCVRDGGRILVKPGEYKESLVITKPVSLIGDGPMEGVIIDGDKKEGLSIKSKNVEVQGVTIQATFCPNAAVTVEEGGLILRNCEIAGAERGVRVSRLGSIVTLESCKVAGCSDGLVFHEQSSGLVMNCEIAGQNYGTGVEVTGGAIPIIRKCTIRNFANGVIFSDKGRGCLEDCDIFGHELSGIRITTAGTPTLTRCKIHANGDTRPAIEITEGGQGTVSGCEIYAAYSGIEIGKNSNAKLNDCRIRDVKENGLIIQENSSGNVRGCEISGSGERGIFVVGEGSRADIRACKVCHGRRAGVVFADRSAGTFEDSEVLGNNNGVMIADGANPLIKGCKINRNRDHGIAVLDKGLGVIRGCDLRDNGRGTYVYTGDSRPQFQANLEQPGDTPENVGEILLPQSGPIPTGPRADFRGSDCSVAVGNGAALSMLWIESGAFEMGSREERFDNEWPVHAVLLDGFWIGRTSITQAQYKAVMGSNPSHFKSLFGGGDRPVENVSWHDAVAFCRGLSDRTGHRYTLPTEAQWECACRAGSNGRYCFGDQQNILEWVLENPKSELNGYTDTLAMFGWIHPWAGNKTHPVATRRPNQWGLYDMHGNVWEWCLDWYEEEYYRHSPRRNPRGPADGKGKVVRGGMYGNSEMQCRCATRTHSDPSTKDERTGFRIVRLQD